MIRRGGEELMDNVGMRTSGEQSGITEVHPALFGWF